MKETMNIHEAVEIEAGGVILEGDLEIPEGASGLVVFAHGSGSSKHSPRNRYVARVMREHGLGTLLFDLLTRDEEEVDRFTRHLRFDIGLLAGRLADTVRWLRANPTTENMKIGLFGASTGGGAALVAAAALGEDIGAVVSRGGRPDLAGDSLGRVKTPVLLIVGELDGHVITLNKHALSRLDCVKHLEIVRGASHLFEEPGTLEMAAKLAAEWFEAWLSQKPKKAERQASPERVLH